MKNRLKTISKVGVFSVFASIVFLSTAFAAPSSVINEQVIKDCHNEAPAQLSAAAKAGDEASLEVLMKQLPACHALLASNDLNVSKGSKRWWCNTRCYMGYPAGSSGLKHCLEECKK